MSIPDFMKIGEVKRYGGGIISSYAYITALVGHFF